MKDLSIIVPTYNGSRYIADSLHALHRFLLAAPFSFEIVLVDDGSTDNTLSVVHELNLANLVTIPLPTNRGKFGAIREGMARGVGRCRIFTDCDMPYDLRAVLRMAELILQRRFHIVVGDRSLPESESAIPTSRIRKLSSRIFANALRLAITGEIYDSQCGIKGFRGDVADALFPLLKDEGFCGDAELLYIALKHNLEIRRIPVRLVSAAPSRVRVLRDGMDMLAKLLTLRSSWKSGRYTSERLRLIAAQKYW